MVLNEGNYLGDWLIDEFGEPDHCREEVVVLVKTDLPSGTLLGVDATFTLHEIYDNVDPAACDGILINPLQLADAKPVTSITDAANTSTIVFPEAHGLITGDIVQISGATVDAALNGYYQFTRLTDTTGTVTTAGVGDAAYNEATLRVTKINQNSVFLHRGPATVAAAGLTQEGNAAALAAAIVDLAALGIIVR